MRKHIQIKTKDKSYKIIVEEGIINKYLKSKLISRSKIFVVVDNKVYKILQKVIKNNKNIILIKVQGTEKLKSIKNYWKIISILLENKINRSSTLIAIGGGTVGDLCGFIASTVLRGVKFVLIPTTLLSQVDSSVGGKNGINSKNGKNLIGTFYQPDVVIIDPSILKFLPLKEMRSGYAEIVKHALINDKKFYQWLKKNVEKIFIVNKDFLAYAIMQSIKIKAKYIRIDEKENLINSSSRAMLNFGHTFGHALESINKYNSNLTHGEAISIGMSLAAKISYKLKNIKKYEFDDIIDHFDNVGLPHSTSEIKKDKIYKIISSDKKNSNDKINLVLLKKIGTAYYKRGLDIKKVKNLVN